MSSLMSNSGIMQISNVDVNKKLKFIETLETKNSCYIDQCIQNAYCSDDRSSAVVEVDSQQDSETYSDNVSSKSGNKIEKKLEILDQSNVKKCIDDKVSIDSSKKEVKLGNRNIFEKMYDSTSRFFKNLVQSSSSIKVPSIFLFSSSTSHFLSKKIITPVSNVIKLVGKKIKEIVKTILIGIGNVVAAALNMLLYPFILNNKKKQIQLAILEDKNHDILGNFCFKKRLYSRTYECPHKSYFHIPDTEEGRKKVQDLNDIGIYFDEKALNEDANWREIKSINLSIRTEAYGNQLQSSFEKLNRTKELNSNFLSELDNIKLFINGEEINRFSDTEDILADFASLVPDIAYRQLISTYANREILDKAYLSVISKIPNFRRFSPKITPITYRVETLPFGKIKLTAFHIGEVEKDVTDENDKYHYFGVKNVLILSKDDNPKMTYSLFIK